MTESKNTAVVPNKPSWKMRRRTIFSFLAFCGLICAYVVVLGDPNNGIHSAALGWAFGSATATVSAYAGFATIEDINLAKLVKKP